MPSAAASFIAPSARPLPIGTQATADVERIREGEQDGEGASARPRPAAGAPRLPEVAPRDAVDAEIEHQARCSDGRGSLTQLFFSDDQVELARARAICAACPVCVLCLGRAITREEPYGIWGGELLVDGVVVAEKRGRGRPRKVPRPRLVVDEITGAPIAV